MAISTYEVEVKKMSKSIRVELNKEFLQLNPREIELPLQKFSGIQGYDWQVKITAESGDLLLRKKIIEQTGRVELKFTIDGIAESFSITRIYPARREVDDYQYMIRNQQLWPTTFKNNKVGITITANIDAAVCRQMLSLNVRSFESLNERLSTCKPDFKFLFNDGKSLMVHKEYLSHISPVFKAMFAHDTKEVRTGTIEIKDFDYNTVNAVFNSLNGKPFEAKPVANVVGVLRFAEKYIIESVADQLKEWIASNATSAELHNHQKLEDLIQQMMI